MRPQSRWFDFPQARFSIWALVGWLGVCGGCHSRSRTETPTNFQPAAPTLATDVDPAKAWLTLNDIAPAPTLISGIASTAELSASGSERLKLGRALASEQRFTEAAIELEKALRSDPRSAELHGELARMHYAAGANERARSHAEKAIEIDPRDVNARRMLGRLAKDDADIATTILLNRALQSLLTGGAREDVLACTHFQLGQVLESEGYVTAALHEYEAYATLARKLAVQKDADSDFLDLRNSVGVTAGLQRSRLLEKLGDFTRAADVMAEAITEAEAKPEWRRHYAALLARAGRSDEAIELARRLVGEDPSFMDLLIDLNRNHSDPCASLLDLEAFRRESPGSEAILAAYADALRRCRGLDAAIEVLRDQSLEAEATNDLRWKLIDLLLERRDGLEAVAVMGRIVENDPGAIAQAKEKASTLADHSDVSELTSVDSATVASVTSFGEAYLLGLTLDASGRSDMADEAFQRSLDLSDSFLPARIALVETALRDADWEGALDLCLNAPQDESRGSLKALEGEALAALDRNDEAVAAFNEAVLYRRTDTRPRHGSALLYRRTQRPALATQQYQAVLEQNPLDEVARESLFILAFQDGDMRSALPHLEELRRTGASPARIARCQALAELNTRQPDFERFRRTVEAGMDSAAPDADSWERIGQSFAQERRYDEARSALETALQADPLHPAARQNLAEICARFLDFNSAVDHLEALLERHPRRLAWSAALVETLLNKQDSEAAIAHVERVLQREDLSTDERREFRMRLRSALILAGREEELVRRLKDWLAQDPEDEQLRELLQIAYADVDRIDDALALLPVAPSADSALDATRMMTALLAEGKRFEEAQQRLLERLEQDPENDDLVILLANVLRSDGRYEAALELVKNQLRRSRHHDLYLDGLVSLYVALDRIDEAITVLKDSLRRAEQVFELQIGFPETDRIWLNICDLLMRAGRFDEAQERLNARSAVSDRMDVKIRYWNMLAQSHSQQGQHAQAIETLELAYRARPHDSETCNNLGYNLADLGLRLDEAEGLIRQAVGSSPRQSAYLDSLGWVLYKKGDFDGANEWLMRAVRVADPPDPIILDHLADACWRAGRNQEALKFWARSLENPEDYQDPPYDEVRRLVRVKIEAAEGGASPQVARLGSEPVR